MGASFQPRWKEELVGHCGGYRFILEFPMGDPTVYFPSEPRWRESAPAQLRERWGEVHESLRRWCRQQNAKLVVDEALKIGFEQATPPSQHQTS